MDIIELIDLAQRCADPYCSCYGCPFVEDEDKGCTLKLIRLLSVELHNAALSLKEGCSCCTVHRMMCENCQHHVSPCKADADDLGRCGAFDECGECVCADCYECSKWERKE